MNEKSVRYDAIDGIRSYAAICIIAMHVKANMNMNFSVINSIIDFFSDFVFLFFLISGFSMCCGYYNKIVNGNISIIEFYKKRFVKVWPFFATLVILDVIISPSIHSLYEAFADLTLCFSLLPNSNISVIGVGWTLGIIFLFYLLFPFFCYMLTSKVRAIICLLLSLVLNYLCIIYFFSSDYVINSFSPRTNFVYCAVYFLEGCVIFLYKDTFYRFVLKYRILSIVINLFITFIVFILISKNTQPFLSTVLLLILFGCWLIYAIGNKGFIFNNRFCKFFSSISMEVYLSHMVIFRGLEKTKIISIISNISKNAYITYVCCLFLTIGLTIIFSCLVKKAITYFLSKFSIQ